MTPVSPPTPDDPRATHEAAATVRYFMENAGGWEGYGQRYRDADVALDLLVAVAERTAKLEEALVQVRRDVLTINCAAFDSTRGEATLAAIRGIDAALASAVRDG